MGLAYNLTVAAFASLGSFLFGYDSGVIGSVIAMEQFTTDFPSSTQSSINGAIVSVFAGGCFVGAAGAGWSADRLGRKYTIQIGCLIGLLGCALQTGMTNVGMLIAGRAIAGLSVGILSMTCPLYNAEIAPYKIRGLVVGLSQQMIGFGFITASWTTYGCTFVNGAAAYRISLGIQLIPAFILFCGCFVLPFSPRWLIMRGRLEEARVVVKRLHGAQGELEFEDMVNTITFEQETMSKHISVLWSTKPMIHRTLVAMGVQAFGQFTGINVINYFGPQIYQSLGIIGNKALLVQGLQGVVGPITNLFFIIFLVDRVSIGRRNSLIFGALGIAICLSIECALNSIYPPNAADIAASNETAQRTAISMFFLSSIVFSLSFGPVSWVYASEVFNAQTRAMGGAVATCTNWAANVLFAQVSPIALRAVSWKYYLVFVCLGVVDAILVYLFFPETAGKTLEEIDEVFGDRKIDHIDIRNLQAAFGRADKNEKRDDLDHLEHHSKGGILDDQHHVERV